MEFEVPAALARYIARKGSVCHRRRQPHGQRGRGTHASSVNLIPHTLEVTMLGEYRRGHAVNIEVDIIARYLERLTRSRRRRMKPIPHDTRRKLKLKYDRRDIARATCAPARMVVIMDDEDRENEGDLIMAADARARRGRQLHGPLRARPDLPHARRASAAEQLRLPLMVSDTDARPPHQLHGLDRGRRRRHDRHLGARSRAHDPRRRAPRRAGRGPAPAGSHLSADGAARRCAHARGHTEAGCDLARLAGLEPAAVIVEILNDDGTMARRPDLEKFAQHTS